MGGFPGDEGEVPSLSQEHKVSTMPDYIYLLENRLSPAQQNALRQVRDAARNAGMTVFLAGGAVRDLTSGFPVRDLDFSVQGNALKLKKLLEKAGGTLWGEHEPSRTLWFWFPGSVRVEVSSARHEEYPKPGKPVYHWAPILEDLRRRDFTANAMAVSLNEGSWGLLLDPLNGFADIETRHLRLASNYGFIEDPSRMLRAVRLAARTGWEMDQRTQARYQNAKEEGLFDQIPQHLRGYELEEIAHEEDPMKALRALEAEGWMKLLFPGWTAARADLKGLDELNKILIRLMMLGVNPDPSAAHMELLTAKMTPKDVTALKRQFPRPGFVDQWNSLEKSARDFSKELLGKAAATPSAAWKILVSSEPEAVLWLAFSSKAAPVKEKFNNFFNVWPEARQKIPTTLMAEMRITPDLPDYGKVVEALFFQFMDGKLQTEEEVRKFLEPYSPPAPPPPVVIRRPRGRRAEPKFEEEEEIETPTPRNGDLDEGDEDEEHEDSGGEVPEILPPAKPVVKVAGKPSKAEKAVPASANGNKSAAAPARATAAQKPEAAKAAVVPVKAAPVQAKAVTVPAKAATAKAVLAQKPAPAKSAPPPKPEAKAPARPQVAAKAKAPEKKPEPKPAPKATRPAPRAPAKKPAPAVVRKVVKPPAKPAKPAPKPAAKKPSKSAKAAPKKKKR
jgi:tRNA nucleotidyltransferase (CCA-adding enzyme)